MADKKKMDANQMDALYSWIAYDLQKLKGEILNELKYSSVQISALHKEWKADEEKNAMASAQSTQAISQEIRYSYKQNQTIYDGISTMITEKVATSVEEIKATLAELQTGTVNADAFSKIEEAVNEIKYSYLQHQAIYDGLNNLISEDVMSKLNELETKIAFLEKIDQTLDELNARVLEGIAQFEEADYKSLVESVAEKTEESVSEHSRQIINALATIPVPENVDYTRIVDEVGDKMLEVLGELSSQEPAKATPPENERAKKEIDYDRIVYGTAEKVVESLPYVQKVDYNRIDERFEKVAKKLQEETIAKLDVNAIADAVVAKMQPLVLEQTAIDYDKLSDLVVAKLTKNASQERVDYERIATIVEEKSAKEPSTYELVVDEDGMNAIADRVSMRICDICAECAVQEETEQVEEESATEACAEEELAVTESVQMREMDDQLVDAETGLVIRLKKSFTAKLKQSEEEIKTYYSDIKNALTSYKKINSNVSWHGDRFNFGRDTVAKMAICGKTLCLYLALDPENPEFKQTVYHQKNVGDQKAHESTPLMVKIKSSTAVKKAIRLIAYLAEEKGAVEKENFQTVNYAEEFAYASTKQLFDEGYIKVTKEKKVEFNF